MRWAIRTVRSLALAVAVLGAVVAGAQPAGAATQSINGVVVTPVGTLSGPFDYVIQGVVVDATLGVAQFRVHVHSGCCYELTITAGDGSQLTGFAGLTGTVVVPGLVSTGDRAVTITGGTGRFAGASGGGTLSGVFTGLVPFVQLTPVAIAPSTVGSIVLDVTTP